MFFSDVLSRHMNEIEVERRGVWLAFVAGKTTNNSDYCIIGFQARSHHLGEGIIIDYRALNPSGECNESGEWRVESGTKSPHPTRIHPQKYY